MKRGREVTVYTCLNSNGGNTNNTYYRNRNGVFSGNVIRYRYLY